MQAACPIDLPDRNTRTVLVLRTKMGCPKTNKMSTTAICVAARLVWLALVLELVRGQRQGSPPALYMFGDSQLDVGNNNYVPAGVAGVFKANHPRYGVDYPGGVATGRFSNGRNLADFIADSLGAASPPAYRSIVNTTGNSTDTFLKGVNFAYGGARVSSDDPNLLSGRNNDLGQQIERDYSIVHQQLVRQLGETQANAHLNSSIFVIAVGSTDILEHTLYYAIGTDVDVYPEEFPKRLAQAFERHLMSLYDLGMRRVLVVGTGPLGCYPALRLLRESNTTRCIEEVNHVSVQYNLMVSRVLEQEHSTRNLTYSTVDQYEVLQEYIDEPAVNGYADVEDACCASPGGLPPVFLTICIQRSSLCPDRRDHMFWDFLHLTEITTQKLILLRTYGEL